MTTSNLLTSPAMLTHWYVVAESSDVAADPLEVRLLGADYVLWRGPQDEVIAAPNRCPHREMPLSEGSVVEGCLVCPYHGWEFGGEGRCVNIPSTAEGVPVSPKAHLPALSTTEAYGLIWLCPGEPVGPLPLVSQDVDPDFRRINTEVQTWQVAAPRMVDNFLDITHFPFVHLGTFGGAQDPVVPIFKLEELDDGYYGYRYDVVAANPDEAAATTGSSKDTIERSMTSGFHLPLTVRSTVGYESGLEHIILLLSTPIDAETSYFTFVVWRNDDFNLPAEEAISFDRAIGEEDRVMLERLSGELPLGQTDLVNVQADRTSVEWRRRFSALLGG
jgi:phenylpropionate dioxygenase-like ring-hydroxylating dioxygenase large terminal subunit